MKDRSEEHTSELQSLRHLVCRLLLEKKKKKKLQKDSKRNIRKMISLGRASQQIPTPSPSSLLSISHCLLPFFCFFLFFFFFNDTAPPEISPLPLHDALPIYISPYNVNSILNPILVACLGLGYFFNLY